MTQAMMWYLPAKDAQVDAFHDNVNVHYKASVVFGHLH
jgi:hypothetical protein